MIPKEYISRCGPTEEDSQPNVPLLRRLHYPGGVVDLTDMKQSHNGPTPTTRMETACGELRVQDCVCGDCEALYPEVPTPTPSTFTGELSHYPQFNGGAPELKGAPCNAKLRAPVEQYPGEAERMIDTWTREAVSAIQRARDATTGPSLVSLLEEAAFAVGEALRWSRP